MKRFMALIFLSHWLAACGRDDPDDVLVGTLERDRLELIAEANEPIVEVSVHEGDKVTAGTPLVRLNSEIAQARLDQSTAALNLAEHRLAELIKGPRAQEITEARAAHDSAASREQTSQKEFRRVENLVSRRLLSDSDMDQARARRDGTVADLKQANARLNLLLEGTRREEIDQAEAEVKRVRAALAEVQTSVARYTVVAPRDGTIEALPYKLGERPPTGAPVVVMLADGTPYARIYIPESRRTQLSSGTAVEVRVDGQDRFYSGRTRFIAAQAQFTPYYALTQDDRSRLSFLAEIDLPESEAASLQTGIPVQVTVPQ